MYSLKTEENDRISCNEYTYSQHIVERRIDPDCTAETIDTIVTGM